MAKVSKKKCLKCNKKMKPKKNMLNYCSLACRNSRKRSSDIKQKTSETLKLTISQKKTENLYVIDLLNSLYNLDLKPAPLGNDKIEKTGCCLICNSDFTYIQKRSSAGKKFCSDTCNKDYLSQVRSKKIVENGTYNFKTKKRTAIFNGKPFPCDSALEIAGLIFIHHVLKASHISKFESILNFKIENKTHRFNPDFFAIINEQKTIVEVKMKWSSNSEHIYNQTMKNKKESLDAFCKLKQMNYIWLDFDYSKYFSKIYRKVLKDKTLKVDINKFQLP